MDGSRAICSSCGYDRSGTPTRVCPECGSPEEPVDVWVTDSRVSPTVQFAAAILLFASPMVVPVVVVLGRVIGRL
ncbi:MAG: hypothetical protein ACIARR_00855 [Phycisphaerales bacterium JB059]